MEWNGLSCIFQPSRAPPRTALPSHRTALHSLTKLFATTHVTMYLSTLAFCLMLDDSDRDSQRANKPINAEQMEPSGQRDGIL